MKNRSNALPLKAKPVDRANWYRWARGLILLLFLGAMIWTWVLVHDPNFMPVQKVQVDATYQHVERQTITDMVTPYVTDQGLFTVNTDALKQHLLQIPWLKKVLVQRIWPDTIKIKLTEQVPVAVWNNNALLNPQANIFAPSPTTFPSGLPHLNGPDDQAALVWQTYQQFNQALAPIGLQIIQMDLNPRRSWQMLLNNNTLILLGRTELTERLQRFISAYPKVFVNNGKAKSVDLRYTAGFAVQWETPPAKTKLNKATNATAVTTATPATALLSPTH